MELWKTIMKTFQTNEPSTLKKSIQHNQEKTLKEDQQMDLKPGKKFFFIENSNYFKEKCDKGKIIRIIREWTINLQNFKQSFVYLAPSEKVPYYLFCVLKINASLKTE